MRRLLTLLTLCAAITSARANNISITGISVTGSDVTFSLSWDNSWNTANNINPLYPNNWDGVWLFVKYQNNIDNLWKHAKLSNSIADHSVSGGGAALQIEMVTDSMGVFVRRTSAGSGSISNASVTLKMGPAIGSGQFNFKVFGTEMVYVPQDTFQVGDGNTVAGYFLPQTIDAAKENGVVASGQFYLSPSASPAVPAAFPLGYNAFWCMKYEASSEQWADFLNTLTYDQQAERIVVAPNSAAGTDALSSFAGTGIIEIDTPGLNNTLPAHFACDFTNDGTYNQVNDGQNIPVTGLSKGDLFAFLDWAGLRPMTEPEFEKAARGKRPRVLNEYAWGSTSATANQRAQLSNGGQATESLGAAVVNGRLMANAVNVTAQLTGPGRSGLFATGTTGREASGAGFWGIMELSGNVWETVVEISPAGVSFTGAHGDGTLTTAGAADVPAWPSSTLNTGSTGTHARGGDYFSATGNAAISVRGGSVLAGRSGTYGGRGVRTAP